MDKAEYQQKLEELTALVQKEDFQGALPIVEEIDWKRVKSIRTLSMVADVYEANKDYKAEKRILQIAYSRSSIGRGILYRLVEVCLALGETEEADRYFREFAQIAQNDNSRYILQYKLYKAKRAPLEAQIAVLEEYRDREYTEQWAYELAQLYHRAGEREKCVEACDDLILWFSEGDYVIKAMELKKTYQPLTAGQQAAYEREMAKLRRGNHLAATAATLAAMNGGAFSGAGLNPDGTEMNLEQRSLDLQNLLSRNLQNALGKVPAAADGEGASDADAIAAKAGEASGSTGDVDLDAFLSETAGSFSQEIESGHFDSSNVDTAVLPDIEAAILSQTEEAMT